MQMVGRKCDPQRLRTIELRKVSQRIWVRERGVSMVLNGDSHAEFLRFFGMRLHVFEKLLDRGLSLGAFGVFRTGNPHHDHLSSELFDPGHLFLQTKRTQRIARAHRELCSVFREKRGEGIVAHLCDLLALVAVDFAPNVDGRTPSLRHFRQNRL